ncbi:MAG: glutamate--tRNA ligase [Thermoanaerobaculia bacterium]
MSENVRVRFAPSPTGHLHVGGARTAIFNWLFASHHGGTLVLRVEDTDQARSTVESEQMVLDDLRWLGVEWNEGPDVGGPHHPYRQSERMHLHREYAEKLVSDGLAYRCFCNEEDLERKRREAEAAGRAPHYDLGCFRLTGEMVEERRSEGLPHVIRFHVPKEREAKFDADVTIHDLIRGDVTWKKEMLGDFIILRSDGMPTYNFSVVCDDHDMEITHVVRAEEHLTNTHRQVLLYRAFGWAVPQFAHVSLILGEDRTKLSKRHGATSVSAYAEEGYLPDALFNYLTLLGWSAPNGEEIFTRAYAAENFTLERVNDSPAIFDVRKFTWMNGQYIQAMAPAELRARLMGRFIDAGWVRGTAMPEVEQWLEQAVASVQKGRSTLDEFVPALAFFFLLDPGKVIEETDNSEVLADESALGLIRAMKEDLERNGAPRDAEGYAAMTERLKAETGLKGKKLFMPLRVALTGSTHGPELQRAVPLMQLGSEIEGLAPVAAPAERVARLLDHLER